MAQLEATKGEVYQKDMQIIDCNERLSRAEAQIAEQNSENARVHLESEELRSEIKH